MRDRYFVAFDGYQFVVLKQSEFDPQPFACAWEATLEAAIRAAQMRAGHVLVLELKRA